MWKVRLRFLSFWVHFLLNLFLTKYSILSSRSILQIWAVEALKWSCRLILLGNGFCGFPVFWTDRKRDSCELGKLKSRCSKNQNLRWKKLFDATFSKADLSGLVFSSQGLILGPRLNIQWPVNDLSVKLLGRNWTASKADRMAHILLCFFMLPGYATKTFQLYKKLPVWL